MIPKIIWQTYESDYNDLPSEAIVCISQWKKLNPDWEHRYMSSKQRQQFVLDNYGEEWNNIFINIPFGIIQANVWRYMILNTYGGVYADLDVKPLTSLDSWINKDCEIILNGDQEDKTDFCFSISIIISKPNNIILTKTLETIKNDFKTEAYLFPKKIDKNFVFNFGGELALRKTIRSIYKVTNFSKESVDLYNNLFNGILYCNDLQTFNSINIHNLDGAKNWHLGYNDWWKEVEKNDR